jgi:hypothetical protein
VNVQLLLFGCPSSSAWQSEGFVNLRSWVQIPPRADIGSHTAVIIESVPVPIVNVQALNSPLSIKQKSILHLNFYF